MKLNVKKINFRLNVIQKDTETLIRTYRLPLMLMSVLMGFLLFIMNVFLGISLQGQRFNDEMKGKLGVYIYLKDSANQQEAITIKTQLEAKGLKVAYTSKEDALKFVEKRVDDLTKTLKKYNLKNPIPSTLYINYSNVSEFEALKGVLDVHTSSIMNMNDLSENAIKTQEKRVLNIINLSNFLQSFGYLIVGLMIISVLVFSVFFLQAMFEHFRRDVQAKKLLGASSWQIAQPFLRVIYLALGSAFLLSVIFLAIMSICVDGYLSAVFHFSLINRIADLFFPILWIGMIEFVVLMLILIWLSYWQVMRWNSKLK